MHSRESTINFKLKTEKSRHLAPARAFHAHLFTQFFFFFRIVQREILQEDSKKATLLEFTILRFSLYIGTLNYSIIQTADIEKSNRIIRQVTT